MIKLKEIRKESKMNQMELAKLINVERSMISKLETGASDINGKLIIKICEIFKCSADELLGLK